MRKQGKRWTLSATIAALVLAACIARNSQGCFIIIPDFGDREGKYIVAEFDSGPISVSCFDEVNRAFPGLISLGPADAIAVSDVKVARPGLGRSELTKEQAAGSLAIYLVHSATNSVSVSDAESSRLLTTIRVGLDPRWIDVASGLQTAYVSNRGSDSVTVIDMNAMREEQTIELLEGARPYGVTPSPDGERIYVVNTGLDSLSAIDAASGEITATVPVGEGAMHVAVSPDGQLAYVTSQTAGTVSVFDTLSMALVTTVENLAGATSVVFDGRGNRAFVTGGVGTGSGQVFVIRTSDHTRTRTISVGRDPVSVRMSPYESALTVSNQGAGSISVINPETERVRRTVQVGRRPSDTVLAL